MDSNKVVAHSDTVNRLQQVSIEKIRMSVSFTCVLELNCYYVVVFSANLHSYADLERNLCITMTIIMLIKVIIIIISLLMIRTRKKQS